jgi:hypothetical protein
MKFYLGARRGEGQVAELLPQGIWQEGLRQEEHLQDAGERAGQSWYRNLRRFWQGNDELLIRSEAPEGSVILVVVVQMKALGVYSQNFALNGECCIVRSRYRIHLQCKFYTSRLYLTHGAFLLFVKSNTK